MSDPKSRFMRFPPEEGVEVLSPRPSRRGGSGGAFGHSDEDRRIPSLTGRKVMIVTDDRDLNIERVVTNIVLESAGAGNRSCPIGYSDFFSVPQQADLLILRSSRVFSLMPDALLSALKRFREANPKAAVIVCAFEFNIVDKLQPLKEAGVVNMVECRPPSDDNVLLRAGAAIMQKLESL